MLPGEFWDAQHLILNVYNKCTSSVCIRYNLTRMELDILLFLANNPQFDTASDIIERRLLTKSHVSTSVKTLAERGFLTRFHTPDNHKTIHLSLCATADPVISDGRAAQNDFFEILFSDFSTKDRQMLREYLLKIVRNVKTSQG